MQIICRLCRLMTCHVVGGGEQRGEKEQICQKCESCLVLKTSAPYKLWITLLLFSSMKLPCWISSLGWISRPVVSALYFPAGQRSVTWRQEVVGDLEFGPSGIWTRPSKLGSWGVSAIVDKGFIGNKDKLVHLLATLPLPWDLQCIQPAGAVGNSIPAFKQRGRAAKK